jgi:hypothetical protein
MIGLIVLGVFGLYLLVSIIVVAITYRAVKQTGVSEKRAMRAGGVACLIMYLLLFWDWVPTVVAKQYYCRTQGGFFLYKTLDQWKQENPGVAETLRWKAISYHTSDPDTGMQTYFLNQRFSWEIHQRKLPLLAVAVSEHRLVDRKTTEVLARSVTVGTGYPSPMVGGSWKTWLRQGPCDPTWNTERAFSEMEGAAKKLGRQQ